MVTCNERITCGNTARLASLQRLPQPLDRLLDGEAVAAGDGRHDGVGGVGDDRRAQCVVSKDPVAGDRDRVRRRAGTVEAACVPRKVAANVRVENKIVSVDVDNVHASEALVVSRYDVQKIVRGSSERVSVAVQVAFYEFILFNQIEKGANNAFGIEMKAQ